MATIEKWLLEPVKTDICQIDNQPRPFLPAQKGEVKLYMYVNNCAAPAREHRSRLVFDHTVEGPEDIEGKSQRRTTLSNLRILWKANISKRRNRLKQVQ